MPFSQKVLTVFFYKSSAGNEMA